jgi:hypothetical protein
MHDDLEAQMAVLEDEFHELLSRLEEICQEFLSRSAAFLASWYRDTALELMAEHPEVTNQLGQQRSAVMMAAVSSLQGKARSIIDETVGTDAIWWHRQPGAQWYWATRGNLTELLSVPLDQAAGRLEQVLRASGYVGIDSARYRLRQVMFPPGLVAAANTYEGVRREAERLKRRLEALKRARLREKH